MYSLPKTSLRNRLCQGSRIIDCVSAVNQKRFAHDIVIRQKIGKPIIKYGPGGRSSVSGHIATVFGCTGFLGRYVVSKLAKHGTQVVVPYRDADEARHLKVTGDLGQVIPLEFDIRNEKNIEEAVRHSDIVYNLIGRDYETNNFPFEKVHVEGAARIARISRENGVSRFVHVSALNADKNSKSKFYRSKALGEEAVKAEYPDATIVRPSTMYGHEDRFLNRLAGTTYEYVLNKGMTRIRPVYALDVAKALEYMSKYENTIGETYELFGSNEYTYNEIYDVINKVVVNYRTKILVPKSIALLVAKLIHLPFISSYSTEDVERAYISDQITPGTKTFEDLEILPSSLDDIAISVVRFYRRSSIYDEPMLQDKNVGKVKKGIYYTDY
ncbi:10880_t:CDS:10 [Acaulospora morrowiae]|uniref:10880_t:CDS:1 n=1 Tax=Acaulospora morrowiae TaxID=94023 RepID=A0A9N8VBN4_9GLOM|nr:10880_t:CDS:10 [Acaulospora morrowiae]